MEFDLPFVTCPSWYGVRPALRGMEFDLPSWYGFWVCTCSVGFDCGSNDGQLIYMIDEWHDYDIMGYGISWMCLCCNVV
ncbi:hypothetical protein Lalb_Chr03g0040761 [Lupinus albus]|uniref:Uncharacterized protein n=1 Tax=Lupinus albus TaxID=3870 RepID=A0A6A4QWI5_LUPAL|nr:hypothetical protein Lalb_Chr03g0040761 [Lupinus albus]